MPRKKFNHLSEISVQWKVYNFVERNQKYKQKERLWCSWTERINIVKIVIDLEIDNKFKDIGHHL